MEKKQIRRILLYEFKLCVKQQKILKISSWLLAKN